ncbi:glycosyltransferase [Pseudodesulfovibrio sp.]|uniref:glycosyltransferase n=1 Tax=Pseudodesulfovibrio sp. TaxID=2035812 RepID=UPI0026208D80|nr:glycosyltransferase [Pseudodesulfovibrio sp.]MDD3313309.1 glycosyltransferase [Pseudodesulfovibrio sp.]
MKILHIGKFAHPARGGIETFVRDLSVRQACDGNVVTALCHQERPGLPGDVLTENGVTIFRASILCSLAFAPIAPSFPLLLRRIVRETRPQVVHLHLPSPAVLFHAFLPKDVPLIVQWHADVLGSPSRRLQVLYPFYRVFERRCLAKAARIIASSPPYLESSPVLAEWKGKCRVIPLGLDRNRYPEDATATKAVPPLVVSVGRFAYYKGFEHLVRAARLVTGVDFVIAGDGPLRESIRREVERLGLVDRVRLPGAVSDAELHVLLQRAALFCLPSVDRGEAFGMSQLEAMRYGLPIVATAIPGSGTGWVNRDGVTGRVVPPASPEALAEAIQGILDNPELARGFGEAARLRFEECFAIDRVAGALADVYRQVARP